MSSWSPYNYTFNDPIKHTDPNGKNPIIGALVGAVVGGGVSIGSQLLNGESISWKEVGKATAVGALTGAIIGTGVGAVAALGGLSEAGAAGVYISYGAGVSAGIAGETASQALDIADGARENLDLPAIAKSGAVGGALNVATAGLGSVIQGPVTRAASNQVSSTPIREAISQAQKAAAKAVKQQGGTNNAVSAARSSAKAQVRQQAAQSAANTVSTITQTTTATTGTAAKQWFYSQFDRND